MRRVWAWWVVLLLCALSVQGKSRLYYVGQLDNRLPIQLDLTLDGKGITGAYYYESMGSWIPLKGTLTGATATVRELDAQHRVTGTFTGPLSADRHSYSGTWTSGDNRRRFPFSLTAVATYLTSAQRTKQYELATAYPHFLAASPALRGLETTLAENVTQLRTQFLNDVKKTGAPAPEGGGWAHDDSIDLQYYSPTLVSLLGECYEYTGGAHGLTSYRAFNYRLVNNTARPIALADLFTPGADYLAVLSPAVLGVLKEQQAQWVLEGQLTSFTAQQLATFTLNPRGITFYFNPYDVGPYAEGPHIVVIPYQRLAAVLNPAGPVGPFFTAR